LTHTDATAFEIGRNIATTPGKVIKETPLYQLIQYAPTTKPVLATPLLIFPPWINRFYILDLNPQKSFVRWAVEQGLTVFVVSWKSADASMIDVTMDDYVVRGQIDAIDTVRDLLGQPAVHVIGYCVAGTALACTLALLAERGQADKVASATFFTAQVDFEQAGDLKLFIDDEQLQMIEKLSADTGYLDGRYMALTFNLLRGRDLIWNYVVDNYLLGQDYSPFDLLHWNGDTTNLPAKWHQAYLSDLYRDNRLAKGDYVIDGTRIDLSRVRTPAYVQAGKEDHIAPVESVFKLTRHLAGPVRFVLAGSGHIAGVVNPPAANKYHYAVNEAGAETLDAFVADAVETKGSWWPDWFAWIRTHGDATVPATRARIPGKGALPAIEDAPGRYVRMR
jgi:polyhydroxyalkanoate synthase